MLRLTLVNDFFNPMVTNLDFPNDFCMKRRTLWKASDTGNEELFQILLIFLELSRRGNVLETFLAAIKGIVCLLGQVFINDPVGRHLQNVFRKDGKEVFLGPTLESKSCGGSKIGKNLRGIHDSIICLLPL